MTQSDQSEPTDEAICPMCNRPKDRPATMTDDAYSVFKCPHPFHWREPAFDDQGAEL
jgi:hypothetical protein